MKKIFILLIIFVILCANLALCEAQRQDALLESEEINNEYIYFYELVLSNKNLTDRRRMAYKTSYQTFLINTSKENYRNNPDLYDGLIEE